MNYSAKQKDCSFQRKSNCQNVHVENENNSFNSGMLFCFNVLSASLTRKWPHYLEKCFFVLYCLRGKELIQFVKVENNVQEVFARL